MRSRAPGLVVIGAALIAGASIGAPVRVQECVIDVPEWSPRGSAKTARPRITATLVSTCAAAIDLSSIHMTIDDEPVMPTAEGTGPKVTVVYTPTTALVEDADHTVTVAASDLKGAKGRKTWTFHLGDTYSR
jgi:hypothetical protein